MYNMQFAMPPNQPYKDKEYLRNVLETMKQRMIEVATSATKITTETMATTETTETTEKMATMATMETMETPILDTPIGEFIIGVGYILLILVFVTRVFFKTLNRFTTYYSSSSSHYLVSQNRRDDGVYNRFGFMINADSDSEFSSSEDDEEYEKYATTTALSHSLSSLSSLSSPLPKKNQLPQQTPQSPPPPLRRSKRLQMKSEMNLTRLEKQTQTNYNTYYSSSSASKVLFPSISSDPVPNKRVLSFVSPSPHPEYDEELAFEINRRYEKRMQKRSECNSPPLIRRLLL